MKQKSQVQSSRVKSIARTWIYAPVIATSVLAFTQPTLAAITNTATASGTSVLGAYTSPDSNTVSIAVVAAAPSLSVSKSVLVSATVINGSDITITDGGDTITFQYIITNNGNVTINNVVPVDTGPTFTTAALNGTGTMGSFVLTSATDDIIPGQTATFTAIYTLSDVDVFRVAGITPATDAINNTAQATGTPASGTLGVVPDSSSSTLIAASPLLSVTKSGTITAKGPGNTDPNAEEGDTITYTYTVINNGNVAISGVVINDTHEGSLLAPGTVTNELLITDGPLSTATPAALSSDAGINGSYDLIQPGATVTFTYVHTVTQAEVDGG